jgi:hypothetical protein
MSWKLRYKDKYEPIEQGASLSFGSAVDEGVMTMLKGDPNYMKVFQDRWHTSINMFGKATLIFDNPDIVYSYADFDRYILKPEDETLLNDWINELGIIRDLIKEEVEQEDGTIKVDERIPTAFEVFSSVVKRKKNPYKKFTATELVFFSRASWLSLKRKGEILLEAFKEQMLPKIKKVHASQLKGEIVSDDKQDSITGALDFIVDLEGFDKPVIVDLKTASQPYKQEQIDMTEQLTLYYAMKGKEYNTDLVGYMVLCKNIPKIKDAKCSKCGHARDGKHKKCNNLIDNKRCNGDWTEVIKPAPEVQLMVQSKNQDDVNGLYMDYTNILAAMKQDMVYKNTDKCNNFYGSRCAFYDKCHNNSDKGLRKK